MAISTAIDASAIARTIGIQTLNKIVTQSGVTYLPQRVALVGQGNTAATYATTKVQVTDAQQVGQLFGYGSPLHLAALQLIPLNGDGLRSIPLTVYPLEDDTSGVASVGSIVVTGTASAQANIQIKINGQLTSEITIANGSSAADAATAIAAGISAAPNVPVTAAAATGTVTTTSKWKGVSANDINLSIIGAAAASGLTFAITQHTNGAANPDVDSALAQIGGVWETMVVNCLNLSDSSTLDKYSTFNEGRWDAQVRKPLVVFTGNSLADVSSVTAITDNRKTDRTNVTIPNPGSANLPFETAAAAVARIARSANNNPARDFGRLQLPYVETGLDSQQWTYAQRDQAVKGGASTIELKDGVVNISDTVTMYHPTGEVNPGFRFVKDIVKIMNVIFNVDLIFNTTAWDGAPLIPDDQPTINRDARRPKDARAALATLATNLGREAIISDVSFTIENTLSEISQTNPNRLDSVFPVKISGNVNIQSIDLNFGFYFGASSTVA